MLAIRMNFTEGDDLSLNCFVDKQTSGFRYLLVHVGRFTRLVTNYEDILGIDVTLKGPLPNFIIEGPGTRSLLRERGPIHYLGDEAQFIAKETRPN